MADEADRFYLFTRSNFQTGISQTLSGIKPGITTVMPNSPIAPVTIVADRWDVKTLGMDELSPKERAHILTTIQVWARKEWAEVMPLISDLPPELTKLVDKLETVLEEREAQDDTQPTQSQYL